MFLLCVCVSLCGHELFQCVGMFLLFLKLLTPFMHTMLDGFCHGWFSSPGCFIREYLEVLANIGGTAIVSMGKNEGDSQHIEFDHGCLLLHLRVPRLGWCHGRFPTTSRDRNGQDRCQTETVRFRGVLDQLVVHVPQGAVIAVGLGEMQSGLAYCATNPDINKSNSIIKFLPFAVP